MNRRLRGWLTPPGLATIWFIVVMVIMIILPIGCSNSEQGTNAQPVISSTTGSSPNPNTLTPMYDGTGNIIMWY